MPTTKTFLLPLALLVACISYGETVQCYFCTIETVQSLCYITSAPVNCTANEKCFTAKSFSFLTIRKGCLTESKCNMTAVESTVDVKYECCNGDLCNGVNGIKLSVMSGWTMVVLWAVTHL
ncbi:CD59 glycoprotein-like [Protopterus annectens]|uniref:CD59 glycoprotein-like n=1 Tax=Protopterus annectens TaxID=7888 RepID=UPI001CFADEC2|nr:CD59 glycoprotein-like [Protopterus annectens]